MKLFCLMFFVLSCTTMLAQTNAIVISKKAQFFSEPSIKAKLISILNKGAKLKVEIAENKDGWYYVSTKNNKKKGWIHGNSIKFVQDKVSSKTTDLANLYEDEWLEIDSSEIETVFYNPAKGSKTGSKVKLWIRYIDNKSKEIVSVEFIEVNCKSNMMRSLTGVTYGNYSTYSDGRKEFFKSGANNWDTPKSTFSITFPDSLGESIVETACQL